MTQCMDRTHVRFCPCEVGGDAEPRRVRITNRNSFAYSMVGTVVRAVPVDAGFTLMVALDRYPMVLPFGQSETADVGDWPTAAEVAAEIVR